LLGCGNYCHSYNSKNQESLYIQALMLNRHQLLIILSFAAIYIIWGSTYLFASFALEQIPAFRTCAYRYVTAALLVFLFYKLFGAGNKANRKQIKNSIIAGFVFLGLGTGGAIWSLNYVDTGLTALIIAGEPLIIVLMLWVVRKSMPSVKVFLGVLLGLLGIYLLVSQDVLISDKNQWLGILTIFMSMLAWGAGSIFVSKAELPKSYWLNSAIQMLVGGLTCALISLIVGEHQVPISKWTSLSYFSLSFLIVFGSVIAFTAFNFLLLNVSTEKVVTNTYVNPIIAMILGYLYNDEVITFQSMIAAVVLLVGVFFINTNKDK